MSEHKPLYSEEESRAERDRISEEDLWPELRSDDIHHRDHFIKVNIPLSERQATSVRLSPEQAETLIEQLNDWLCE